MALHLAEAPCVHVLNTLQKGKKAVLVPGRLQLEQELPSARSAIYIGIGCKALISPESCFFPSFLLVYDPGGLPGFSCSSVPRPEPRWSVPGAGSGC